MGIVLATAFGSVTKDMKEIVEDITTESKGTTGMVADYSEPKLENDIKDLLSQDAKRAGKTVAEGCRRRVCRWIFSSNQYVCQFSRAFVRCNRQRVHRCHYLKG